MAPSCKQSKSFILQIHDTSCNNYLDDKYVEVVDSLDVILGAHFGHVVWVEEPAEVDLGVGVAVVQDHVEELRGGFEDGLLVHLEADSAAVGEVASGGVELTDGAHLRI